MAKEILEKSSKLKREFNYQKGEVSLNFTLSMEDSSQLRRFLSILNAAQEDVERIIAEMKN